MTQEKLLITGASGVIGKVLVPKLAESYDVYSVDQNLTSVPGRLFKADLSDYKQIASVISTISDLRIIVHLAANSTADASWQSMLKNKHFPIHLPYTSEVTVLGPTVCGMSAHRLFSSGAPQLTLFLVNFSRLNPFPIPLYTLSAFDSEISLRVGQIYANSEPFAGLSSVWE
jgi:hypothetical protein